MYHTQGIAPPSWKDLPEPGGPPPADANQTFDPNAGHDPNAGQDPNQYNQYPPSQPPPLLSN